MRKAHLPYKGGGFCFETQNKKIQVIVIVCGNCNGILYDSCCCIGGRRRGRRKITNSQELIDAINNQKTDKHGNLLQEPMMWAMVVWNMLLT